MPDGIKNLTDAELVEAVAREVLGCSVTGDWGTSGKIICKTPPIGIQFDPFHDMNDLTMVLEKFDDWRMENRFDRYMVTIWPDGPNKIPIEAQADTLPRVVLEAALKAKGEKG